MATTMTTTKAAKGGYRVVYERDERGLLVADVPAVAGCHTQGRSVDEARRLVREALELFVDDAATATLTDDIRLPSDAKTAVKRFAAEQRIARVADMRASLTARRVVRVLRGKPLNMSTRDAAAVLGLSHQRVHQLESTPGRKKGPSGRG